MEILKDLWIIVASIITIASVIVRYTPSTKDNEILEKIKAIIEKIALNKK